MQLDGKASVDKQSMINALFSGCPDWDGRDQVHYDGDSFVVIRGADLAKSRLLSMFGATRSLSDVDASIASLVRANCGWLAGQSDDTVDITSGEFSANLEQICQLVMSSLSPDITAKVKALIESVHSILSGDSYFASTRQIDVNLYQKNQTEILCIHTRYQALTRKQGIRVIFLGGSKRAISISFNLRKIGITSAFWESLAAVDEAHSPYVIKDGLVARSPLPESHQLRPTQSDPSSSPNATPQQQGRSLHRSSATPTVSSRVPLTPMPLLSLPTLPRRLDLDRKESSERTLPELL